MSNLSVYLYDDAGDRTWKLTGEETQMQITGETTYSNVYLDKTLYTSPYLVMTEHEYTKHYFIEGERVCSKVGGGFGPAQVPPTSPPLEFIDGDEDEIAIRLHHLVHRNIDCTGYSGEWDIHEGLHPAHDPHNDPEDRQYFYHPDHLGSSSFITERHGEAEQHLQYLPFGELFTSQRNHNFDARYKFSAKELDDESGYTYFGARYYDSDLSNWLSVDPLAKERPALSPYNYVQWNPLNRVDPTGALDLNDEWELNVETGEKTWKSDKGGDETQHITFKYKDQEIKSSFNTTKEEANEFRSIMENEDNDWGLVGVGSYVKIGAGLGPMFSATSTNFSMLQGDADKEFIGKEKGFIFGGGAGTGTGLMFIYGPANLKGEDLTGYSTMISGGSILEGEIQTSAKHSGIPTFNYINVNMGVSIGTPTGSFGTVNTTIEKRDKLTLSNPSYWNRPNPVCFSEETMVYSPNGYIEIQNIMIGDTIFSFDLDENKEVKSIVRNKYISKADSIFKLNINNENIYVTPDHPFYISGKGWTKVKGMNIGDELFLNSKEKAVLIEKTYIDWNDKVYNIEVEYYHNYFIGKRKILVHIK